MWARQNFLELNKRIDVANKKYNRAKAAAVLRPGPVVSWCRPEFCLYNGLYLGRALGRSCSRFCSGSWVGAQLAEEGPAQV